MTTTVRVSDKTHERLKALGTGQSADQVINSALDALERRAFWDAYAQAARDDELSTEELVERAAWDDAQAADMIQRDA